MDLHHLDVSSQSYEAAPRGESFNNQAVLGALSSLQQKIKRLEQERDFYIEAAQKARQHVESFKAETEALREQERRQHDEVGRQRDEEIRRLKEDRPRLELELQHTQEKALHTERLMEAERKDFNHKLTEAAAAATSLREEVVVQQEQIRALELQLENEKRKSADAEQEKARAQANVSEIITLNELLFSRLQEAERPPAAVRKSRTGRSASASRRAQTRSSSAGLDRHTVASQRRIRGASPKHSFSTTPQGPSIHERLKRINQGDIPFVPAGRAGGGDSFNKMARVQHGLDLNVINNNLVKYSDGRPPATDRSSGAKRATVRHADPASHAMDDVYARFSQEYGCINRRYREEIERMRTNHEVDPRCVDRLRNLSEELQAKGEDMRALGEHESRLQDQIETLSRAGAGPHIRGLDKRTKTLELFEEMKRIHSKVMA